MTAKSPHDKPRLLIGRPPHARAKLEDDRGDYTNRPDKAMRGEPEAVGDRDLEVFAVAAHANDADRVDLRVTSENRTLRRCIQTYEAQFKKLRDALHNAETLPNAESSLNLARRITHDLEKLAQSLT